MFDAEGHCAQKHAAHLYRCCGIFSIGFFCMSQPLNIGFIFAYSVARSENLTKFACGGFNFGPFWQFVCRNGISSHQPDITALLAQVILQQNSVSVEQVLLDFFCREWLRLSERGINLNRRYANPQVGTSRTIHHSV